jgi:uncharacterized protein
MTNNITTYTGRSLDPLSRGIKSSDIDIVDIATALSRVPRFNGHTKEFFSVAQHSCMVADRLRPGLKLAGLLHDAAEAYLLDIPSPIKQHLPLYYVAEDKLLRIILKRYGLEFPLSADVHRVDQEQLEFEIKELMTPLLATAMLPQDATPSIRCWNPDEAKHRFLEMFNSLYTEI